MKTPTLESVIRQHITLPNTPSTKGFYPVLCKVCNDHGRKGPRAGFKFEGDNVGYNCFNCGHTAKYEPSKHVRLSNNMITVMDAFGIPKSEYSKVYLHGLQHYKDTPLIFQKKSIEPKRIDLPKSFYLLSQAHTNNEIAKRANAYLENRKIDPSKYNFYLSSGNTPYDNKWVGRLIIPIYKDEYLIFYQGRDMLGDRKKYLSPATERDKVLYGFDQLFLDTTLPLYVVEGFFDAFSLDGVAILGSRMTEAQIEWLNKSHRPKIVIPDRYGDGHLLAQQAIELGWNVATPDVGDCKDVNEAIVRYGKLYVMKTIIEHTHKGFFAKTAVRLYCD